MLKPRQQAQLQLWSSHQLQLAIWILKTTPLAGQVWAAGRDLDVDEFQMATMSQLSASFAFGTLYRDAQTDQLAADVTIEFELADSTFTLNPDAKDFEHLCEGLLGVESHRCNFRSLCGVRVICPSTLLKSTCSHAITLLKMHQG